MASKNETSANTAETEALKKDVKQLREDLAALAENFKKSADEQAHAGLNKARDHFQDAAQEAGRYTSQWRDEIEARPYTSVIAAFGVGLLLGKLFSR